MSSEEKEFEKAKLIARFVVSVLASVIIELASSELERELQQRSPDKLEKQQFFLRSRRTLAKNISNLGLVLSSFNDRQSDNAPGVAHMRALE